MKAVRIHKFGGSIELSHDEIDQPSIQALSQSSRC